MPRTRHAAVNPSGSEQSTETRGRGRSGPKRPTKARDRTALAAAEEDRARRVAERLSAELSDLVSTMPIEHRTISAMARWLGITRPVCQRVVQMARHQGDPLAGLSGLPGVQGIAGFVQAARAAGCDRAAVDAVEAATAAYADLIDRHGGSQARLVAAIGQTLLAAGTSGGAAPSGDDGGNAVATRRRLFEAARLLTRRELEAQVGVFLYRPLPDDPKRIDCVTALGLLGLRVSPGAMPLCPISTFAYGDPQDAAQDSAEDMPITALDGRGSASRTLPVGTLRGFSSRPEPRVIARRRGGRVSVLVEPTDDAGSPCDVVLAARIPGVPHPALHEPRAQDCHVHSDGPARRLVLEVHLHRSIAMRSVAQTGAYVRQGVGTPLPAPGGRVHVLSPRDQWAHRLPDVPRLEYLGLGLEHVDTPAHARQRELVESLFRMEGWSSDEFVGYRIQVDYPVWNAQYLMRFEFPDDDS